MSQEPESLHPLDPSERPLVATSQPGHTSAAPRQALREAGPGEGAGSEEAEADLLPFPLVAIGSSAGGLEACREVLKNLPVDSGMAFVLIAHLAPDQKSHLVEILGGVTGMQVSPIEDQRRPEPNHLYILPPNTFASLSQGRFRLEPRPRDVRVPRPIDYFFRSLAFDQKSRAIGVILSGEDSDGAKGLKAIKGEGGIAIVQQPESARHPGMPRSSIAADHVDLVLPPREIGSELGRLGGQFTRPELRRFEDVVPPPAIEGQHFTRALLLLGSVSGIDFRQYKPATPQRRIARRMMLKHFPALQQYVRYLQSDYNELRDLHDDVLIGMTSFFRDPDVWDAFKTDIIPQLFRQAESGQPLRIWVPGCSTGEEVYSIAMCLIEHRPQAGEDPPIQIFGTDVCDRLVQTARLGMYPESIAEDVSAERLRRFFIKGDHGYQITKRVRDLCVFARQNLCGDPPFSRLDLLSCRNVLIYFGAALHRRVVPTFHYALRPGGVLLVGMSETLRDFPDLFASMDRKHKFYVKAPGVPAADLELPRLPPAGSVTHHPAPELAAETWTDMELQRAADRIVLGRFSPAGVVVNDRMEILQSRGHIAQFLETPPGTKDGNLAHMLRDGMAGEVYEALQRAVQREMPVRVPGLKIRGADPAQTFTLEVQPVQTLPFRGRCFLVLFIPTEVPAGSTHPVAEPTRGLTPDEKDQVIAQLRRDLHSTRFYLQSLIEERDLKNQDLVSANEEIHSANEELQSANEELETTREEIQSAN